jgi:hypothetical protein
MPNTVAASTAAFFHDLGQVCCGLAACSLTCPWQNGVVIKEISHGQARTHHPAQATAK